VAAELLRVLSSVGQRPMPDLQPDQLSRELAASTIVFASRFLHFYFCAKSGARLELCKSFNGRKLMEVD